MGTRTGSDHNPLFLHCVKDSNIFASPTPFRFQPMWLSHVNFIEVVRPSWVQSVNFGCPFWNIMFKLRRLKQSLKLWNKDVFGNVYNKLGIIDAKISEIQQTATTVGDSEELWLQEVSAQSEYQRADLLKHKSRFSWLTDGDRNTSYFHRAIKMKRSSEVIK